MINKCGTTHGGHASFSNLTLFTDSEIYNPFAIITRESLVTTDVSYFVFLQENKLGQLIVYNLVYIL